MKKNYLLWFAILAFLMVGCRNENFNTNESNNDQQALKFRVISKTEIPKVINALQAKTNNFKVLLGSHSSAMGKTETVFGEINTDFIIEKQNDGDTYYVFVIRPSEEGSKGYNLELKANESENYEMPKYWSTSRQMNGWHREMEISPISPGLSIQRDQCNIGNRWKTERCTLPINFKMKQL